MNLEVFQAGPLSANNYLLTDNGESVLIDCSQYLPEKLEGKNLKYILLTHGHFDHVLGVNETKKHTNAVVFVHKDDVERMEETASIVKMFGIDSVETPQADAFLTDGDVIKFGNCEIKVMHTAGHTQGGLCYLVDGKLFSGDTLFKDYVGRCDLPGGDFAKIKESVKDKLFNLPDETEVYSGHGEMTTIGYEKKYNEINS